MFEDHLSTKIEPLENFPLYGKHVYVQHVHPLEVSQTYFEYYTQTRSSYT